MSENMRLVKEGRWLELIENEKELAELQKTFSVMYAANHRGIKAWQAAHPGNDLVWPDQAKMVEWMCDEITRLRKIEAAMRRQEESHRSIAICLLSPTQQGVESCRKQALRFADEALAALAGEGGG